MIGRFTVVLGSGLFGNGLSGMIPLATVACRRSLHPFKVKVSLIEPGRYPTPLNTASHVLPYWQRAWGNASPEVKAEYGEDYYKAC